MTEFGFGRCSEVMCDSYIDKAYLLLKKTMQKRKTDPGCPIPLIFYISLLWSINCVSLPLGVPSLLWRSYSIGFHR